jgi:orotate phosphoribosyltransferase
MKNQVIKKIIELELFKVAKSFDKKDWILLKNGERVPVFLDTAKFISYPELQKKISALIFDLVKDNNIKFDKILGIPYGGLFFSYNLSAYKNIPCLAIRKEGAKKYSTSGEILGVYQKKERVLLIEDACVTGRTAISFIERIRKKDLVVKDVISILDIGGPAKTNFRKRKVKLYSLFDWSELYTNYRKKNILSMNEDLVNFLDKLLLSNKA